MAVGPMPHKLIRIKAGLDHTSLVNQGGPGMPKRPSMSLIRPYSGCRIHAQTMEAATAGTMEGRKNVARKNEMPRILELSRTASRREMTNPSGTAKTQK